MRLLRNLLMLLLAILAISFAILNAHPVAFHYYSGEAQIPLSYLLLASLICGVLLASLVFFAIYCRLRCKFWKLQRERAQIQKEE